MRKHSRRILRYLRNRRVESTPFYARYKPRVAVPSLDLRSAVSRRHRFVLFRVPKSANSTVISTLYYADTGAMVRDRDELEGLKIRHFDRCSELSAAEVDELESSYYKFTFVRNPMSRVLSCYRDKIVGDRGSTSRMVLSRRTGIAPEKDLTFAEFLRALDTSDVLFADAHWAPQLELLPIPPGRLDLVGKVETLARDLAMACRHIFGRDVPSQDFREHATNADGGLVGMGNEETALVEKLYGADFDALGYPRPTRAIGERERSC